MAKVQTLLKSDAQIEAEIVDLIQRLCATMNEGQKVGLVTNFSIGKLNPGDPKCPFIIHQLTVGKDHTRGSK